MSAAQLHMIFPTVVLRGHIEREFTEEEKNVVRYHADHVRLGRGKCQSQDTYVLNDPKMAAVKDVCMAHIQAYIDQVFRPAKKLTPYITQSWFSYYNKGGYTNPHHHMNSVLSGVLYFQAEDGVDSCSFLDTRYTPLLVPATHYDEVNSDEWVFGVKTGTILIFRSDAVHAVRTTESERTRICLAFNTYFDGEFGTDHALTTLRLENNLK